MAKPQLISTWFKYRRGVALGTIIGGLALGSSLPHLIVGAGGVGDRWRIVTVRVVVVVDLFLHAQVYETNPFEAYHCTVGLFRLHQCRIRIGDLSCWLGIR